MIFLKTVAESPPFLFGRRDEGEVVANKLGTPP